MEESAPPPRARAVRTARTELRPGRRRCSRSARIRAGDASSSRGSRRTEAMSSTSPRAPVSSPSSCVRDGHAVTGLDQSPDMLAAARARFGGRVELVRGVGRGAAVRRCVVRPSHLHVPPPLRRRPGRGAPRAGPRRAAGRDDRDARVRVPRRLARPLWELYVRVGLPLAGRAISPGWHEVGRFLGPSIRGFWRAAIRSGRCSSSGALRASRACARRRLSLGGGIVVWGTKRS